MTFLFLTDVNLLEAFSIIFVFYPHHPTPPPPAYVHGAKIIIIKNKTTVPHKKKNKPLNTGHYFA